MPSCIVLSVSSLEKMRLNGKCFVWVRERWGKKPRKFVVLNHEFFNAYQKPFVVYSSLLLTTSSPSSLLPPVGLA